MAQHYQKEVCKSAGDNGLGGNQKFYLEEKVQSARVDKEPVNLTV